MILEAQARQKYFWCFNVIINDPDFLFSGRNKRPPKDPINALISFGNTLLYQRFEYYIANLSSLDIRFGIVHNSYHRTQSFNLDLADLFKPVLVDRTIFTLINRNMINAKSDFEEKNGGIYMNQSGKRKYLEEFDRKLNQQMRIKDSTKSYDMLMRDEVRKVENYFKNGQPYKPYKYIN